ncbi:MAG: JAB domain-containing protein, partial [SAR324 cluster bacterium]|nr:JAB domain-containing protein [SAR324 cluster bacterium]
EEDKRITRRLQESGELLGIPLLDHIIISKEDFTSFADEGWL